MNSPNPVLQAAAPELIAVIQALQAFFAAEGADPTKWAQNYPGAKLILVGTILQQVPALLTAEGAAGMAALDAVFASWIAALEPQAKPA